MSDSVKQIIIKTLEGRGWQWGGALAREVHELTAVKESVIERRARELVKSGALEAQYQQVDGTGPKCVMWRIALKERKEVFKQSFLDSQERERAYQKLGI